MVILFQITILLFLIEMSRMHTNTSFKKKGKIMREEGGKQRKGGEEKRENKLSINVGVC